MFTSVGPNMIMVEPLTLKFKKDNCLGNECMLVSKNTL